MRYLEFATQVADLKVAQAKITILAYLTDELKAELNLYANWYSALETYPVFEFVHDAQHYVIVQVSMRAMTEKCLADNELIFPAGVFQESMYLVLSGQLLYVNEIDLIEENVEHVEQNDWVCEAALYTEWESVGELFTDSNCMLMLIDGETFCEIVAIDELSQRVIYEYGAIFTRHLSNTKGRDLSDVSYHTYAKHKIDTNLRNIIENRMQSSMTPQDMQSILSHHKFESDVKENAVEQGKGSANNGSAKKSTEDKNSSGLSKGLDSFHRKVSTRMSKRESSDELDTVGELSSVVFAGGVKKERKQASFMA
jgi:hypothetical protein